MLCGPELDTSLSKLTVVIQGSTGKKKMAMSWVLDEIINENKQISEQYIQYDLDLYFKIVSIYTEKYLESMQQGANSNDFWVMKM